MQLRQTRTLVTGASSGLGREITRLIVKQHGGSVVAVARRTERLRELQQELGNAVGAEVLPLTADLASPEAVNRCFEEATALGGIDHAILNAGVTYYGKAIQQTDTSIESIIHTNNLGLSMLALRFARYFVDNKKPAHLMFVSSMTAFSPMPYQAVYAATKAFVTSLGLSLREELRGTGVVVTVFCPGGILTEMGELSGTAKKFGEGDIGMMDAPTCARYAVGAWLKGSDLAVPGFGNWIGSVAQRLAPRALVARTIERIYRSGLDP